MFKRILQLIEEKNDVKARKMITASLGNDILAEERRVELANLFFEKYPYEARDELFRFRDMIPFTKDEPGKDRLYEAITVMSMSNKLDEMDRIRFGSALYADQRFSQYVRVFDSVIAYQPSLRVKHECFRFLYATRRPDIHARIQKQLISQFLLQEASTVYADCIAPYVSIFGVKVMTLFKRLHVAPDPEFHLPLNYEFVVQDIYTRDSPSACKHLLVSSEDEEYHETANRKLNELANNPQETENTRADALDVLLRTAKTEEEVEAVMRRLLAIGRANAAGIGTGNKFTENSQNVHTIHVELVENAHFHFSESMHVSTEKAVRVLDELASKADAKAVRRIEVDIGTYRVSGLNLSLSDILIGAWTYPCGDKIQDLQNRILEELKDASGTCATGHVNRIFNAFVGIVDDVRIIHPIRDEIKETMNERIRVELMKMDEDTSGDILIGMTDSSSDERKMWQEYFIDFAGRMKLEIRASYPDTNDDIFNYEYDTACGMINRS